MKTCTRCHREWPLDGFYPDRSKRDGRHTICKECVKAAHRARHAAKDPVKMRAYFKAYYAKNKDAYLERSRKLRQEVLAAYGGKCACCGESTPEFLGIDHVNNDGESHRRELKGYGKSINRWLKMNGFPQDGRFQLLCHNCNMAKGCYGGCPHQGPPPGMRQKTRPFTSLPPSDQSGRSASISSGLARAS